MLIDFNLISSVLASGVENLAENTEVKKSFIETLGIDWKIFIAQIINFALVLLVLWKWVYPPLLKIMRERTVKIEKGLQDAEQARYQLEKAEETIKAKFETAGQETQNILYAAGQKAEQLKLDLFNTAKKETDIMIAKARETIIKEKDEMMRGVRAEIADLVVVSLKKILDSGLSENIDSRYITEELVKYKKM